MTHIYIFQSKAEEALDPSQGPTVIIEIEKDTATFKSDILKSIIQRGDAANKQVFIVCLTGIPKSGKSFLLSHMQTYLDYYDKVWCLMNNYFMCLATFEFFSEYMFFITPKTSFIINYSFACGLNII